jgi:deoxyribodipyrimidine photo-lyase
MRTLFWFRRDRRLQDNEALLAAAEQSSELIPLYVFPENLYELTPLRQASLIESVTSLSAAIPSGIKVLIGDSAEKLSEFVRNNQIDIVFATRAFDTTGMLEQASLAEKLHELSVPLKLIGSYYAIEPGTVRKDDGSPLRVYTPFYKRWSAFDFGAPFEFDVARYNWTRKSKIVINFSTNHLRNIKRKI